jgi:hypothetical protein
MASAAAPHAAAVDNHDKAALERDVRMIRPPAEQLRGEQ